jgi:hypothetical protein
MRAQAFVLRCTSPSCATADVVTQLDFPDLVFVGDRFTLRIEWDAVNSQYLAAFNGGLSMPLAYAPGANAGPPRGAFADIRVQDRPASCTAGATITEALLEIGDVWTNPSALVP